jgi:hypothetical protein
MVGDSLGLLAGWKKRITKRGGKENQFVVS